MAGRTHWDVLSGWERETMSPSGMGHCFCPICCRSSEKTLQTGQVLLPHLPDAVPTASLTFWEGSLYGLRYRLTSKSAREVSSETELQMRHREPFHPILPCCLGSLFGFLLSTTFSHLTGTDWTTIRSSFQLFPWPHFRILWLVIQMKRKLYLCFTDSLGIVEFLSYKKPKEISGRDLFINRT